MKILSLLIVLLALFRETRHQFPIFYPAFSLSLANEEFIEPPIVADSNSVSQPKTGVDQSVSSPNPPTLDKQNLPIQDLEGDKSKSDFSTTSLQDSPPPPILFTQEKSSDEDNALGAKELAAGDPPAGSSNRNVTLTTSSETGEGNETHGSQTHTQSPPPGPVVLDAHKKGDEEEPIPSYMEWAQKKQLELKSNAAAQNGHFGIPGGGSAHGTQGNGQNGQSSQVGKNGSSSSASSGVDAKNFASPDCGAKVVQSNSESQNPSGVLSSSHDEYMLNKCGTAIWFVIELCEPLTIERISIGNLELFSSSPKEVEFGISDRYPTRDWVKLGPFTLPDARAIHPVVLPATNASTFGKFVKISIHSHHGSEHYCPISGARVNGKSEYEVLESETTHQEDENKEGGALYEESIEEETKSTTEGKVGGLKDTVLNILNKAVQSIVRRGFTSYPEGSSETDQLLKSRCRSVLQCVPHSHMTHDIYRLLSCNSSNMLSFLATHSHWCGWDYCHATFETRSIGLPYQPEGFYASLFGGPSVLHALCHYLKPTTDGCDPTCLAMNNTLHQDNVSEYINESLVGDNTTMGGFPIQSEHETQIPQPISGQEVLEEQPVLQKSTIDQQGSTQPPLQQLDTPPVQTSGSDLPSPSSGANFNIVLQPPQQPETQIPPPASVLTEDFSSIQQGQPQQKESVFVRLTNRIKNLERNQSLTASYLEELSKRFKKQNEDSAVITEANKKTLNETRVKMFQLDDFYRHESQSLRRNLDDVRERLFNVQLQRSLLVIICLSQTILIIGAVIWVKKKLATFQQQMDCLTPSVTSRRQTLTDVLLYQEKRRESDPLISTSRLACRSYIDSDNRPMVMRKRSNSDSVPSEKAKRLRKRNKKQLTNPKIIPKAIASNPTPNLPIPIVPSTKTTDVANPDFNLKMPKSLSGDGFFDVSASVEGSIIPKTSRSNFIPFTPKENVDPQFARIASHNLSLPKSRSLGNSNSNSPTFQTRPQTLHQPQVSSALLTNVDSPFTFQSQISPFIDSGISTSSRFALLASPTRDSHSPSSSSTNRETYFAVPSSSGEVAPPVSTSYNRSGSMESSASTISTQSGSGSTSQNSYGGFKGIFNGNHRKHSASDSSNDSSAVPTSAIMRESQAKKEKKGGLKAFIPKFFDR